MNSSRSVCAKVGSNASAVVLDGSEKYRDEEGEERCGVGRGW